MSTAAAPTRELSVATPYALPAWAWLSADAFGVPGGGILVDTHEIVGELRWPVSVRFTYPRMATDSQLKALERGTTLPISRYAWGIDENGANPAIVQAACADWNLPLIDDAVAERKTGRPTKPVGRARGRFSFTQHLAEALKALRLGAQFFEQVGEIGDDGFWHPLKLAEVPAETIEQIAGNTDGGLVGIKQAGLNRPPIMVEQIVGYVFDRHARGDWFGTSMYRACYREWLLKDRLLRIDAINHERAGGVLVAEAPKDASHEEVKALGQLATDFRVGGGAAVPAGTGTTFVRATGTGVIDSINRHDEAMARAWLLMAIQLGSTATGARAVASVQQELWGFTQEAIAIWFRDVFNEHVLEDWVDWNYGLGVEYAPRLVFIPPETTTVAQQPTQPPAGVTLDPATEAALTGATPQQVSQMRAAYERENKRYRQTLARTLPHLVNGTGEPLFTEDELLTLGDIVEADEEITETLHERLADLAVKPTRGARAAAADPLPLPARTLRRQPYEHEIRAQVDYAALDKNYQSEVDALVTAWQAIRSAQITQLHGKIVNAGGSLAKLAKVHADTAGADAISPILARAAAQGAAEAVAEAQRQGRTGTSLPSLTDAQTALEERAAAAAELLTGSLSQAAGNKAVQLAGGGLTATEVADQVTEHLNGLSDTYLRDQFGGAVNAAQNTGRLAVFAEHKPSKLYASELLDVNCCQPCIQEDGTEFESLADAAKAYPTGGYRDCQGGPRCRGTIVAIFDEAA